MTDDELERLGRKIDAARGRQPSSRPKKEPSPAGEAMRMGTEFAGGVLVGAGVGYFLDRWLDTTPIFLMVCVALGAVAGFRTMMRSARAASGEEKDTPDKPT
jgi:ATP synthase protein I